MVKTFERKLYTLGIFTDLTKVFDHLNHSVLISNLEASGVRGVVSKLASYAKHDKQYVHQNSTSSCISQINTGVPQGSILGLFCLLNMLTLFLTFPATQNS